MHLCPQDTCLLKRRASARRARRKRIMRKSMEGGGPVSSPVWTGSNADGTASTDPLGFSIHGVQHATFGNALDPSSNWITGAIGHGNIPAQMYAISSGM